MSPDLITGLVLGAMAGAFGVALIPAGQDQKEVDPGPPPERPHNMLGKPEPYDPANCWCGKSHPGYGHNRVDPHIFDHIKSGDVLIPSSEIKEGLHKKGGLNDAPTTPRPPAPPPPYHATKIETRRIGGTPPPPPEKPSVEFFSEGGFKKSRCTDCNGVLEHHPGCITLENYKPLKSDHF